MNARAAAGSRRIRWQWLLVAGGLARLISAHPVHGQASTPNASPKPSPAEVAISIAQLPEYAERTDSEIRAVRARMEQPDARITSAIQTEPEVAKQIEQLDHVTAVQIAAGLTPSALEDVTRQWRQYKNQLSDWSQAIAARLQVIEQDSTRLNQIDEIWAKAAVQVQQENLPEAVRAPIRTARTNGREAAALLRDERDRLLGALALVSSSQAAVSEGLARLELAQQRLRRDLFTLDSAPLWTALPELGESPPIAEALRGGLQHDFELLKTFLRMQRARVATHALLILLILFVTATLSRRQRERLADDTPLAVRTVLTRPISATLLLAAFLNTALYPYAPVIFTDAAVLLVAVIMLRLFRSDDERAVRHFVVVLVGLFVIGGLRRILPALGPTARLLLLVQDVVVAAYMIVVMRSERANGSSLAQRWGLTGWIATRLAVGLTTAALLANGVGNVSLAMLLTDGVLRSAFAGLGLVATARVIEGLLIEVLASQTAQQVRSLAIHRVSLRHRMIRATRIVMAVLWAAHTLDLFAVLRPFVASVRTLLTAEFTMGAVVLSLGSVLAVVFTVWLSILAARLVRVVLGEDILPRLSLPRGVPAAISAGANYLVLVLGVIVALSAAGIDPGRVTLVAGALSVGIGFGLQTVVNNFVSGLILLLERPIQLGDTIEIGGLTGQVRHIGIRSSTIATFDGAEVIVPNATLIAERVVNWTLSNFQRRIELSVGVAYGNDPARVLEILEGAARGVEDVLENPPPQAVFVGFGDSSLDFTLRAWTNRQDIIGVIRSRIALAVYDVLRAAGIEIPFPQRELHVKIPEQPSKPAG